MEVRWQDGMKLYNCFDSTSIILCPLTSCSRMYDVGLWILLTWSFED